MLSLIESELEDNNYGIVKKTGHYTFSNACDFITTYPDCGDGYMPTDEAHTLINRLTLAYLENLRGTEGMDAISPLLQKTMTCFGNNSYFREGSPRECYIIEDRYMCPRKELLSVSLEDKYFRSYTHNGRTILEWLVPCPHSFPSTSHHGKPSRRARSANLPFEQTTALALLVEQCSSIPLIPVWYVHYSFHECKTCFRLYTGFAVHSPSLICIKTDNGSIHTDASLLVNAIGQRHR